MMSHSADLADPSAETPTAPGRGFLSLYVLAYFGGWLGVFGPAILALYTRLADLFPPTGTGTTALSALAIVSGVGAVAATLANPFIGRLSDRTTSKWGMRTPWLVISSLIFVVGSLIVAFGPANLVVVTVGWAVSQIGFNGMLAVYVAVYTLATAHDEVAQIRANNPAADPGAVPGPRLRRARNRAERGQPCRRLGRGSLCRRHHPV